MPKRLTWHPDPDVALGWTRDGRKVLFTSSRDSYSRIRELFLASLDGGLEEKLPLPMGHEGSLSPDGQRIAYVPLPRAFSVWKRYRGGQTTPIWIATLANSRIEKVPRENSNDFSPMWVDDRVFFLSDRNGPVTLFSYDTKARRVTQAVPNTGMDFKSASAGPGGIVIEQFGQIQLYDIKSSTLVAGEDFTCRATSPSCGQSSSTSRAGSRTRTSRRPAPARCSRRAARSSRCLPKRATRAT